MLAADAEMKVAKPLKHNGFKVDLGKRVDRSRAEREPPAASRVKREGDMVTKLKAIGEAVNRIDGILKVTGAANYSLDFPVKNVADGFIFKSTIAAGTISDIDTTAAEKSPGVIAVITHKNASEVGADTIRCGRAPPCCRTQTLPFSDRTSAS